MARLARTTGKAVIVTSYGEVSRRTLRYPKAEKPGNDLDNPRVLRSTGVNCSIEGAERVFAGLRRRFNSRGAQSFQTIVSFSQSTFNPDDPEDVEAAMKLLVAIAEEALPPGLPSSIWSQADGDSGCLHGHIVSCTTLPQDCELDGKTWKAGRKLAGAWTETVAYRTRCNEVMARHGFDNELVVEPTPDVRMTKFEQAIKRRQKTYDKDVAEGKKPSGPRPRSWRLDMVELIDTSLDDPRALDWDGLNEVLAEHDASARINPPRKDGRVTVTWFPPGRKAGARGTTLDKDYRENGVHGHNLGDFCTFESVSAMLDQSAAGLPRRRLKPRQIDTAPPKQLVPPTAAQIDEARAAMVRMAAAEKALQDATELDDWILRNIDDEDLAARSEAMWSAQNMGLSFLTGADREQLRDLMLASRAEQAARREIDRLAYEEARRERLTPAERRVDQLAMDLGLPHDEAVWNELQALVIEHSPELLDGDMDAWVNAHFGDLDRNAIRRRAGRPEVDEPDQTSPDGAGPETSAPAPVSGLVLPEIEFDDSAAEELARLFAEQQEQFLASWTTKPSAPAAVPIEDETQGSSGLVPSDTSVPAAVGSPASAPASASESAGESYRSRVRELRGKTEEAQRKLDRLADFDEVAHDRLARGLRIEESQVPKGIGPKTLVGEVAARLDPAVLEQLSMRAAKKERRQAQYDTGRRAAKMLLEMARAGLTDSEEWEDLTAQRAQANRDYDRLGQQIAAGIYEVVDPEPAGTDEVEAKQARDLDHELE